MCRDSLYSQRVAWLGGISSRCGLDPSRAEAGRRKSWNGAALIPLSVLELRVFNSIGVSVGALLLWDEVAPRGDWNADALSVRNFVHPTSFKAVRSDPPNYYLRLQKASLILETID